MIRIAVLVYCEIQMDDAVKSMITNSIDSVANKFTHKYSTVFQGIPTPSLPNSFRVQAEKSSTV
jgi:hypothetical protein